MDKLMHEPRPQRRFVPFLFIFLASLAAIVPLILHGPSCGHDFDFHLLSWIETATDWHSDLIYPHWLASANYGAGEPRFIFYPPISWFLGAAFGAVGNGILHARGSAGWTAAPILFTWISFFASGLAVYQLARDYATRYASTVAACLFIANPYLLFVAYERTAYGELLSTAFIAILLLLALRPRIAIIPLSLATAALWLTNAPAAVMGCYTLAFIAAFRLVSERRVAPAMQAGLSCAGGTALAGFYLVPAAYEQRWVQIDRAIAEGMRIQDSFFFEHTGQGYHDVVLHSASVITAVLVCTGAVAASIAMLKRRDLPAAGERQTSVPVLLSGLLLALLFLQFRASNFLWRALPRLLFLQFPWRWLVVISIVVAVLIAIALRPTRRVRGGVLRQIGVGWLGETQISEARPGAPGLLAALLAACVTAVMVAGSIWACSHDYYQACDVDDAVPGQLAIFHSGSGVEGTDEYTARDADNSEVLQDIPQVRVLTNADAELPPANAGDNPEWISDWAFPTTAKATFKVTAWQPQYRSIEVNAAAPAFAVLTLMDYPAWQITLNGKPDTDHGHREDGLIALAIPAGRSTIDIRWKDTPDIYWGRWLSALAALALLGYWFSARKKRTVLPA